MQNCIRVDPRDRKSDGFFVCIFKRNSKWLIKTIIVLYNERLKYNKYKRIYVHVFTWKFINFETNNYKSNMKPALKSKSRAITK